MPVDPNGGVETLVPVNDWFDLVIQNGAGEDSATVRLDVTCAHEWMAPLAENPPSASCPSEAHYGTAAQQPFENGLMIWLGINDTITAFYEEGPLGRHQRFQTFTDEFEEGDPESDPEILPPDGLYQPIRGFGLVWRTHPKVRECLG